MDRESKFKAVKIFREILSNINKDELGNVTDEVILKILESDSFKEHIEYIFWKRKALTK